VNRLPAGGATLAAAAGAEGFGADGFFSGGGDTLKYKLQDHDRQQDNNTTRRTIKTY